MHDQKQQDQVMEAEEQEMDEEHMAFFSDLPDLTAKQARAAMGGKKLEPQQKIKLRQKK